MTNNTKVMLAAFIPIVLAMGSWAIAIEPRLQVLEKDMNKGERFTQADGKELKALILGQLNKIETKQERQFADTVDNKIQLAQNQTLLLEIKKHLEEK